MSYKQGIHISNVATEGTCPAMLRRFEGAGTPVTESTHELVPAKSSVHRSVLRPSLFTLKSQSKLNRKKKNQFSFAPLHKFSFYVSISGKSVILDNPPTLLTFSRRPISARFRVQSHISSREPCDEQTGTVTVLSPSTLVYPCQYHSTERLRWSRGSVLVFGTQVRGFAPGRTPRNFRAKKILSTPSFGREVKPSVTCRSFMALPDISRPQFHLPPLGAHVETPGGESWNV